MQPTAPLTYAQALTSLNLLTTQTASFTFTTDEMNLALTNAWNDSFVVTTAWDNSLTYSAGTWQYAVPATLATVKEVYLILPDFALTSIPPGTSDQYPGRISSSLWEVVNGKLQFAADAQRYIPDSHILYLKGNYKLQITDSLPTVNLINYVLWIAADNLMLQLLLKSAFVFLRNDTNIAMIVAAQKITGTRVLEMKQRLFREFQSA